MSDNIIPFSNEDITVVVQGPVVDITKDVLLSVRKYLPGSQIILSTWEGSDVAGLDADLTILNKDPGGHKHSDELDWQLNNLNRQIVSSANGLKKVKTKYALKMRTEYYLTGCSFLESYRKYQNRSDKVKITKQRIAVCSLYTRFQYSHLPLPYHVSDWFYFGLAEDLLDLVDIPLPEEPSFSNWFKGKKKPDNILLYTNMRFAPEQYMWLGLLHKKMDVECGHYSDMSGRNDFLSFMSIVNNTIVLDKESISIHFPKYTAVNLETQCSVWREKDWKYYYDKYCVKNGVSFIRSAAYITERFFMNFAGKIVRMPKDIIRNIFPNWYLQHFKKLLGK